MNPSLTEISQPPNLKSPSISPLPPRPRRPILLLAALTLLFFALRLLLLATAGWNTADEAWILQIVARTSHGQPLYKNVFFNCTPLSIYLARALCSLTGPNALALKALCAAIETATFLATLRCLRHLSARLCPAPPAPPWLAPKNLVLLALVMLLIPSPAMAHLYNDLATLLVLLTALAVFRWTDRPTLPRAATIALLLGLAVGEKQNIGAYLSLAAAAAMLLSRKIPLPPRRRTAHLLLTTALALFILALILLPTFLAGATREFLTDTLLMKGQYLQAAPINFFQGFSDLALQLHTTADFDAASLVANLAFPLALLALAAFLAGLFHKSTRPQLLRIAPFLLVLAAGIFPRADAWHLANAFPAMIIPLALAAAHFPRPARRLLTAATALLSAGLLTLLLSALIWRLHSGLYTFSRLPHLRGILLSNFEENRLASLSQQIAQLPQPLFILSPDASAYYLLSNTPNPTPYDYPIASELPPGSQQQLITALHAGQFKSLLLQPRNWWWQKSFIPDPLQSTIESTCPPGPYLNILQLRYPPAAPP